MGRSQRRLCILASALALGAVGCSPGLGPSHDWVPFDRLEGPLRPEACQPSEEPAAGDRLRLVTFNVHGGEDVEAIAGAFLASPALAGADLAFLQEIRSYPAEGRSRAARLADALGMGYAYAPARTVDDGTHGLAILTRFPLENLAVMELPRAELPLDTERRIALQADVTLGGKTLRLVGVHLDTRLNAPERILQLRPAIIALPPWSVVAGDFNTNPELWALRTVPDLAAQALGGTDQAPILDNYMASLGFANPTAAFGPTVSFPGLTPHLDSLYVRGSEPAGGTVERDIAVSDHWPVWLDLLIP